jgi:hypothetical protein
MNQNTLELIKIIVPVITLIIGFFTGSKLQKLKNRPEPLSHRCSVSNDNIYTYFDSNNKPSKPACILLTPEGNCKLLEKQFSVNPSLKSAMDSRIKCYLAEWNK